MENFNTHFTVHDREVFEAKMLNWLKQFNIFCFLNNNNFKTDDAFPFYVAAGVVREIILEGDKAPFESLQRFHDNNPGWLFGHFNYELNTGIKHGSVAGSEFPDGYFFSPEILFSLEGNKIIFLKCPADPESIVNEIMLMPAEIISSGKKSSVRSRITRKEYLDAIGKVKMHIRQGDCYELNYCQEFFCDAAMPPEVLYHRLNSISPQAFSAFYRVKEKYCCCASPERFLKKTGRVLLSQPIKGTAPRSDDESVDNENYHQLKNSSKDRSENVMVVDLVRNDFNRVCKHGTVKVPELFSIRSLPGVFQMVSSVTGEMEEGISFTQAIEAAFPMGSMTGAPKVRVMQLIDQLEASHRKLFSGSIGYINPKGDFDFNVVIRSIFINEEKGELSFMAGGGITHYSDAEAEFEESMLKTRAIRKALNAE